MPSSPERQKEYHKKYREANKEKLAEQEKKYREANKEKATSRRKKWREDNKEKQIEDSKKYREKNKERLTKQRRDWQQDNIENWLKVLYSNCKKRHGFACPLTLEDLIAKHNEQNGLCAVTKIKMDHQIGSLTSISVDRIDNNLGYTKENINLVAKWINLGRGTASLDQIKTTFHNAVCAANQSYQESKSTS